MKSKLSIFAVIALVAVFALPLTANADPQQLNDQISYEFVPADNPPQNCWGVRELFDYRKNERNFTINGNNSNIEEDFVLSFTIPNNLCESLTLKAAIYDMPGGQNAWPQTLSSFEEIRIQEAGTHTIIFSKLCDAQQFDVIADLAVPGNYTIFEEFVTLREPSNLLEVLLALALRFYLADNAGGIIDGSVPEAIDILTLETWHGMLFFFPGSSSAYQYFPESDCEVPTTTTTTSTTTTTEAPSTSVAPTVVTNPEPSTSVLGTVVERPVDGGNSDGSDVQVAGISAQQLPVTGTSARLIVFSGLVLLISGATFALATKKSRRILS